jgi:hypothetical protein
LLWRSNDHHTTLARTYGCLYGAGELFLYKPRADALAPCCPPPAAAATRFCFQAWNNCLNTSSDVKELIPELFYLPEMLRNDNGFHLGTLQDGRVVDDVALPPWANSPEEFIRKHRAALESQYVSDNIHHWVDLVFG